MNRQSLSNFQTEILLLAYEGKTNVQIAAAMKSTPGSVANSLRCVGRKGYAMPKWRPREPKAEQEYREREREANTVSRFTAVGVKKSTGERFEVTSDTKAFSDAHLAAMLGGG